MRIQNTIGTLLLVFSFGCDAEKFLEPYKEAKAIGTEVGKLFCEAIETKKSSSEGGVLLQQQITALETWAGELEKRTAALTEAERKQAEIRFRAETQHCRRRSLKKNDK